jgi:Na+-driven multidrug efflux pump
VGLIINIMGYSILAGLASGMRPVCGQAFGSGNYGLIGLALQRTILIFLLSVSVRISALWYNLESTILLTLRQDPAITAVAATYCLWSLPDLLANSLLQPMRIYLKPLGLPVAHGLVLRARGRAPRPAQRLVRFRAGAWRWACRRWRSRRPGLISTW